MEICLVTSLFLEVLHAGNFNINMALWSNFEAFEDLVGET